jgi:hypothetical protein
MAKEDFRVDFMIIGAQKSGTTSLAAQLAEHPQVCFCNEKEPGYFNSTANWKEGLKEYHALYAPAENQICGEASTMYTFLPEFNDTYSRLYEYNPELRLIYLMRDPVERIVSHFAHRVGHGRIKGSPEEHVLTDPHYINRSRYGVQLKPYLQLFGKTKILLLLFEEYVSNQQETLNRVASFLNITPDPFLEVDSSPKNLSVGKKYLAETGAKLENSPITKAARPFFCSFVYQEISPGVFHGRSDRQAGF